MKNLYKYALPALCVMTVACSSPDTDRPSSLMNASKQELATALSERDELLSLMRTIIEQTANIKRLENNLNSLTPNTEDYAEIRSGILTDIKEIGLSLKQKKEKLSALELKLQKSDFYNAEMRKTIETLSNEMMMQSNEIERLQSLLSKANKQIGRLNSTVESLNGSVISTSEELARSQYNASRLEDELISSQSTANMLAGELNTCYYVVASKSELKKHNILQTPFLRKSKLMEGDFDKSFFTRSDKRNLQEIRLNDKKAKLLTTHPAGSYELIEKDRGKVLKITNKPSFWGTSNYLVIQID